MLLRYNSWRLCLPIDHPIGLKSSLSKIRVVNLGIYGIHVVIWCFESLAFIEGETSSVLIDMISTFINVIDRHFVQIRAVSWEFTVLVMSRTCPLFLDGLQCWNIAFISFLHIRCSKPVIVLIRTGWSGKLMPIKHKILNRLIHDLIKSLNLTIRKYKIFGGSI